MSGLTNLSDSVSQRLKQWGVASYGKWDTADTVLEPYRIVEDSDWEIINVSDKEIKIATNPVHAYLYQYDTTNMLKDLEKNHILVESIVFVVKKSTIF